MKQYLRLIIMCFYLISCIPASAEEPMLSRFSEAKAIVWQDYLHYYSAANMIRLGAGLGVGAVLANTKIDAKFRDWYQDRFKKQTVTNVSDVAEPLGNLYITTPFILGAMAIGEFAEDSFPADTVGIWGRNTMRALIVGTPPVLFFQLALGGCRPAENNSHWRPFQHDEAVSGHSYAGAVPFLTAAKMTDRLSLKIPLYMASTLAGLARIDQDQHYLSQVALGWWFAYLATENVRKTDKQSEDGWSITPLSFRQTVGLQATFRF